MRHSRVSVLDATTLCVSLGSPGRTYDEASTNQTLPQILRSRARLVPDAIALCVDFGAQLTFDEWERRSNAAAAALVERGAAPGTIVALVPTEGAWVEFAVGYVGVQKAGCVPLLVPPATPDARLGELVRRAGAIWTIRASLDLLTIGDSRSSVGASPLPLESEGELPISVSPDDLAQIIPTAGTTREPKLVAATQANMTLMFQRPGNNPPAKGHLVHALPLASNAGQVMLLQALSGRYVVYALERFEPTRFCDAVASLQAVSATLVPAMGLALAHAPAAASRVLPSVRHVGFSGAHLPPNVPARMAQLFPNALIRNYYTSTEAWPALTSMDYDPLRPASVGRSREPAIAVMIAGPDGAELPPGLVGEIHLRVTNVPPRQAFARGTLRSLGRDGWTPTGDLGYLDADGYLYVTGRRGDLINRGGLTVAPSEIEDVLQSHPYVRAAAVVGLPHRSLSHVVTAALVTSTDVTVPALRELIAKRLSPRHVPDHFVFLDELPRNSMGKVVKRELVALIEQRKSSCLEYRTATEREVAAVWCNLLELEHVPRDAHFVAVGGDSLLATEAAFRIGEQFGIDLRASDVLIADTLAELARTIDVRARMSEPATAS